MVLECMEHPLKMHDYEELLKKRRGCRPATYAGPTAAARKQSLLRMAPPGYLKCVPSHDILMERRKRLFPMEEEPYKPSEAEKMLIISPDFVRPFKISSREIRKKPVVIRQRDFERIKTASHVLSKKDRDAILQSKIYEKDRKQLEVQQRREAMRALDRNKMKSTMPDYEREAKEHAEALKTRVETLKKEEQEEIRHLNKMILEAKGVTLLGRQVNEKQRIQEAVKQEEKRLDNLMEAERRAALERQREEEFKAKELRTKYRLLLQQQMKENLDTRIREEEQKLVEQQLMLENVKEFLDEQPKIMQMKKDKQKEMKKGLEESMEYTLQQMLEEKWLDKMTMLEAEEFQKKIDERIKAYEAEKKRLEELKEADRAKLYDNYKQAMDNKNERLEINQRRYQECKEREIRLKERLEMEEKERKRKELQTMQDEQLEIKQRKMAFELQQNRKEFAEILRLQKEALAKEKEKERKLQEMKKIFCQEQLQEIVENEKKHIQERAESFAEALREEKKKDKLVNDLRELKQKKLLHLSEICPDIGEQHIRHIDKKVQIRDPPKMRFVKSKLADIFNR